jgi:uncharacterized protein GlcG (DUF336 family)
MRVRGTLLLAFVLGFPISWDVICATGKPGQVCGGECPQGALTAPEVRRIVAQAVGEAQRLGVDATIAVVDRLGNVLAVFQTSEQKTVTCVVMPRTPRAGLELLQVPATFAAISKAGTAAYLSSQGNAFSTRTASQIVQEHFNPQEAFRVGGPLFGVQFSQLPCGDLAKRDSSREGPRALPLGFSADPGGLPLYLEGVPVGGVGVEIPRLADPDPEAPAFCIENDAKEGLQEGVYDLDSNIRNFDTDFEERIAAAASQGFEAPPDRRAGRITVDGRFLRYADDLGFQPAAAPELSDLPGTLVEVGGFHAPSRDPRCEGLVCAGVRLHDLESGIVPVDFDGLPAEILITSDPGGLRARFPPTSSTQPTGPTADEVLVILREALRVAERARAQIRRPAGSKARVSISVIDTTGAILGVVRGRDAPIFGIDVSLQKARTAAFFSANNAAELEQFLAAEQAPDYVQQLRDFIGAPAALTGRFAFSNRAVGNLARPFFPDGIDSRGPGPLSLPFDQWSPFSTGLQLDLVLPGLANALLAGGNPRSCPDPDGNVLPELANGIQIFPGGVPIYRGSELVGAVGVSGDGVDQDDLIAFLGLHNASVVLGNGLGNAPRALRADQVSAQGVHLRYVGCPPSPFLDSSAQNVCEGK